MEHQRSLEKNLDNGVNRSTTPTQLDITLIPMETGHCGGFKQARVSAKKKSLELEMLLPGGKKPKTKHVIK